MNIAIVTTCPTGMVTSVLSARLLDAAECERARGDECGDRPPPSTATRGRRFHG